MELRHGSLQHAGDLQASLYNSETLELFGEYIRRVTTYMITPRKKNSR